MPDDRETAVYLRVSSKVQDAKSQEPDLKRWASAYEVPWGPNVYRDKFTGKTLERPGFERLMADVRSGKVGRVVIWRIDRLGRTAKGLTALFEELAERKVGLVSIKESLDLETPAGRLMSVVLAGVAAYETEVRAERTLAGQAAARDAGKTWGGSPKGRRKAEPEQIAMVKRLKSEGVKVAAIARTVRLSRPTVYSILKAD